VARSKPNDFEELRDALVADILKTIEALPEAGAPYGSVELTPEEQLDRYIEIRDKPERWVELIRERGLRETLEYNKILERKYRAQYKEGEMMKDGEPNR